jgi:hypothetical protein
MKATAVRETKKFYILSPEIPLDQEAGLGSQLRCSSVNISSAFKSSLRNRFLLVVSRQIYPETASYLKAR